MTTVHGSIALVTGGQRGLGKAFVQELLDLGASKVYATARSPRPSEDPRIVSVALEVDDAESVAALVALTGDVQIVVNNAGVAGSGGSHLMASIEEQKADCETNGWGPIRVAQAYAPSLKAKGKEPSSTSTRRCRGSPASARTAPPRPHCGR